MYRLHIVIRSVVCIAVRAHPTSERGQVWVSSGASQIFHLSQLVYMLCVCVCVCVCACVRVYVCMCAHMLWPGP